MTKQTFPKLLSHIPLKILIAGLLFIMALILFSFITREVFFEHEEDLDLAVISIVHTHSSPLLIQVMTRFTFFGSSQFLLPAYIVMVGFFILKKNYRYAINISVMALSGELLMFSLKQLFHRRRPDLPLLEGLTTYSFPSGHALSAVIFCSIVSYLGAKANIQPVWKWILIILSLLLCITIGISRIILNVHYATDVIAGFSLGVMWVILVFYILTLFGRKGLNKSPHTS